MFCLFRTSSTSYMGNFFIYFFGILIIGVLLFAGLRNNAWNIGYIFIVFGKSSLKLIPLIFFLTLNSLIFL